MSVETRFQGTEPGWRRSPYLTTTVRPPGTRSTQGRDRNQKSGGFLPRPELLTVVRGDEITVLPRDEEWSSRASCPTRS